MKLSQAFYCLLSVSFFSTLSLSALTVDTLGTTTDSVIVFEPDAKDMARLDSLWAMEQLRFQSLQMDTSVLNIWDYNADSVPVFSDSVYRQRLSVLDEQTPFSLSYNRIVQTQINIYANTYRRHVATMLGKANYYFPLFEETLDKYNLPIEFKYLAIVESALKPHARSRSAATGLWQFMYTTGKIYDLKVSSYIDERSDPIKSTEAACQYFTFLYKMFNDWELVLAAYNGGPGYVSRAMRKSGAKDFWSLRPFLRKETQNYVPKFIAVNYIMSYSSAHNIYPIPYAFTEAQTDTVRLTQSVTFESLSLSLGVSLDVLKELNPMYKRELVPVASNSSAIVKLPSSAVGKFLKNEVNIYAYSQETQEPYVEVDEPIRHIVKGGEFLGFIADKYNTKVSNIMKWNSLSSTNLRIGQKLVIYVDPSYAPTDKLVVQKKNGKELLYTIKSGDTLWEIARRYAGVSVKQIESFNNISSRDIKPGLVIKIPKSKG
jgi:membrane-bound lytic murein transglycosylase D